MDLAPLYEKEKAKEATEAQARAEHFRRAHELWEQQRPNRIARAEEVNYAGLRLEEVYRTPSPIILDSDYGYLIDDGDAIRLSLRFRRDLTVAYEFHSLNKDAEVEEESGTTDYELLGESKVRFSFDTDWWETEWEGGLCAEQLRLTFRMEKYGGGPAAPLKAVVEGDAVLLFTTVSE